MVKPGEVYGVPTKLNPDIYTAGVMTGGFLEDQQLTDIWANQGMRVRIPLKGYELEAVFMTTGIESTSTIGLKGIDRAVIAVFGRRNPYTFESAISLLTPSSEEDFDRERMLKRARKILKAQAYYLAFENNDEVKPLVEKLESGEGEKEWFYWLSNTYGQQMMSKTEQGLLHGEFHRQNSTLAVEFGDLADTDGLPKDMVNVPKVYDDFESISDERVKKIMIEEIKLGLTYVLDLKIIFNLYHGRKWDTDITSLTENFINSMQQQSPKIFKEVFSLLEQSIRSETTWARRNFYGLSELTFVDLFLDMTDSNISEELKGIPVLEGTPGDPYFFKQCLLSAVDGFKEDNQITVDENERLNMEKFRLAEIGYRNQLSNFDLEEIRDNQVLSAQILEDDVLMLAIRKAIGEVASNSSRRVSAYDCYGAIEDYFEGSGKLKDLGMNQAARARFCNLFLEISGIREGIGEMIVLPREQRMDYCLSQTYRKNFFESEVLESLKEPDDFLDN
jgi:hypothetical protein